jgi:hypothetical protein
MQNFQRSSLISGDNFKDLYDKITLTNKSLAEFNNIISGLRIIDLMSKVKSLTNEINGLNKSIVRLSANLEISISKINDSNIEYSVHGISKTDKESPRGKYKGFEGIVNDGNLRTAENANKNRLEHVQKNEELMRMQLSYANDMRQNFQSMLQATGLMKGQFGEIINFINSFINSISSGVSFVDSLVGFFSSFIPGGSIIAGAGLTKWII